MRLIRYTLFLVILSAALLHADGWIANGSFEQQDANGTPTSWNITPSNDFQATFRVETAADATDGTHVLHISAPFQEVQRNRYVSMETAVTGLKPGMSGEISLDIKGSPDLEFHMYKGKGPGRTSFRDLGFAWQHVVVSFCVEDRDLADDGAYHIRFNLDCGPADVYLDNVKIAFPVVKITPDQRERFGLKEGQQRYRRDMAKIGYVAGEFATPSQFMPEGAIIRVVLTDGAGHRVEQIPAHAPHAVPEDFLLINFSFKEEDMAFGPYTIEFFTHHGRFGILKGVKEEPYPVAKLNAHYNALEARFKALDERAKSAPKTEELALCHAVAWRALRLIRRDMDNMICWGSKTFYAMRSQRQLDELEDVAKEYERRLNDPSIPSLPVGSLAKYPDFLAGYGFFDNAILNDVESLSSLGINLVFGECFCWHLYPKESNYPDHPVVSEMDKHIGNLLDAGAKNGFKVAIMIDTWGVPWWFWDKYPQYRNKGKGFEPFADWGMPEAKKFYEPFFRCMLSYLKNHPNRKQIHSICHLNEEINRSVQWDNGVNTKNFVDDMKKQYRTIEAFNQAHVQKFNSWDDLAALKSGAYNWNGAVKYSFYRWKEFRMRDFHAWLYNLIHEYLPEVPQCTKMLVYSNTRGWRSFDAIDPELHGELLTLNGNDDSMYYHRPWGNALFNWSGPLMAHDMQYSFKPVPVFNGENHLSPDKDYTPVPMMHPYQSLFQQAIHKTMYFTSWLYYDVDFALHSTGRSSCDANIYHRPSNLLAHALAACDLNRLSAQVKAFHTAPPEVELLYCVPSFFHDNINYTLARNAAYEALSTDGIRVGFRSERQLQRGDFGTCKKLVITNAKYIERKTLDALRKFVAQGGVIYCTHNPPSIDSNTLRLIFNVPWRKAPARLANIAGKKSIQLEIIGAPSTNVPYLTAPYNGKTLLNVINYNAQPRSAKLHVKPGQTVRNLITGKPQPLEFTLDPLVPHLFEIE